MMIMRMKSKMKTDVVAPRRAAALARLAAVACACCSALATAQAAPPAGAPCLIEPYARLALRSPVSATITGIAVNRGSVVRKGQVLVSLDASTEQAALASARHRAVMVGATESAKARVAHATQRLGRREELRQLNYVSAQDRDDAEADMRVATADLLEATDNRALAGFEVQRLAAEVAKRTIVSPVNGVVTERLQHPGEQAQTGDAAVAILKIAQTDPARVEVVLPSQRFGKTKVGDVVTIRPETPAGAVYRATVNVVDSVVDSASGTFGIRLEIPNPKGEVLTGVKCSAEL